MIDKLERFSNYMDQTITENDWEKALSLYIEWCKENKLEPEVEEDSSLEMVSDSSLDHVLYHASLKGFDI